MIQILTFSILHVWKIVRKNTFLFKTIKFVLIVTNHAYLVRDFSEIIAHLVKNLSFWLKINVKSNVLEQNIEIIRVLSVFRVIIIILFAENVKKFRCVWFVRMVLRWSGLNVSVLMVCLIIWLFLIFFRNLSCETGWSVCWWMSWGILWKFYCEKVWIMLLKLRIVFYG